MADQLAGLLHELEGIERSAGMQHDVLEAIAASVPCLVVDLETQAILGATANLEALFGYIPGELKGRLVHDLLPHGLRERHAKHIEDYAREPQIRQMGTREMNLVALHRQGHEFGVEIGLCPRMIAGRRCVVATLLLARTA